MKQSGIEGRRRDRHGRAQLQSREIRIRPSSPVNHSRISTPSNSVYPTYRNSIYIYIYVYIRCARLSGGVEKNSDKFAGAPRVDKIERLGRFVSAARRPE